MDSAALGELISSHSAVTRNGGQVKIFNLTKRVSDLIRMGVTTRTEAVADATRRGLLVL